MKSKETADEEGSSESTVSMPAATLEKWAVLAENLRSRLEATERENGELKERLECQSSELHELREENVFQAERLEDLEFQCMEKSAEITNLSDLLKTRDTSELQKRLLEISVEHSEMSMSVNRLRTALQRCEFANQQLLFEKDNLTLLNEGLSSKVEECTSALQKSKDEQERNKKLLLEMGDVVRTLNCVTIEFERESSSNKDNNDKLNNNKGGGISSWSHQMANIKLKIKAMEEDRQRLIQECSSLRQENDSKHERIQVLETQFQSLRSSHTSDSTEAKGTQRPLGSQVDTETSPISINTSILEQGSDISESTQVSSWSEVPKPPEALLQDHKTLKRYYEEALERIIRMSAELSKSKISAQALQEKQSHVEELKERLEQMKAERDQALNDNLRIERELEESVSLAEIAMTDHVACKTRLEEQRAEYKALQEKYERMETVYSKQLGELEVQVQETEKLIDVQCERLEKKHSLIFKEMSEEKENLEKEYKNAVEAERMKNGELNEEFDMFVEMHTQLEDDLSNLQKKYDEALTKILELEDQLRNITDIGANEKATLENRIEEQEKTIQELKSAVDKSVAAMQEAVVQQQKFRRENETILAKHGKLVTQLAQTQEKNKLGETTIKELRENCCDMENRLKQAVLDATTRFDQLQSSYQMALSRISDLLIQLNSVGLPIGEASMKETVKRCPVAHDRIKLLESELMGGGMAFIQTDARADMETERFHNDYCQLLKKLVETRRHDASHGEWYSSKPIWYDRLVHQSKLNCVHQHLKYGKKVEFSVFDFIRYQRRLQLVLKSLPHGKKISITSLRDASSENSEKEEIEISLYPGFLEHQRRLTLVHYDILASRETKISSSEGAVQEGPNNIDETKSALFALKRETQKVKMAANTAKIRCEAREKEHRVVRIQYQKLLEQYNHALKNQINRTSSSPAVQMSVDKIQNDQEIKRLQEQLRVAELKLDRMTMELHSTKSQAENAKKKQEEGEKNLQDAIGRHVELEAKRSHTLSPVGEGLQNSISAIFRTEDGQPKPFTAELTHGEEDGGEGTSRGAAEGTSSGAADTFSFCNFVTSFDGSNLTSLGGGTSISAEARDEHCVQNDTFQFEGGIGGYLQLQKDHDQALQTIDQLKLELIEAEQALMRANSQLNRREEDLRHVIREYNQIKEDSERLFSEIERKEEAEKEGKLKEIEEMDGDSCGESEELQTALIRERNVALGKISLLETELEKAHAAAKAARKKQLLREDHLRQVIGQYKELDEEHQKSKALVEELKAALEQQSTSRGPGLLAYRRAQGSDENRETPVSPPRWPATRLSTPTQQRVRSSGDTDNSSNQSTKTADNKARMKRKPWFRDLGYSKASSHQSSRLDEK